VADFSTAAYNPGMPDHPPFDITCETAAGVTGKVCFSGSTWFHPQYRRLGLSRILPRVSRVFAFSSPLTKSVLDELGEV